MHGYKFKGKAQYCITNVQIKLIEQSRACNYTYKLIFQYTSIHYMIYVQKYQCENASEAHTITQ